MHDEKKIPAKKPAEYFLKNMEIDFMDNDGKLAIESSTDLLYTPSKYIPVVVINRDDTDASRISGYNIQKSLSKSPIINRQKDNFLKLKKKSKTRLLVKRGVAYISLLLKDIALIYTKDKLVYIMDRDSKKYSIDKSLTELEEELDPFIFFRANRQYIINLNFIRSFKAHQKVKLLVDMDVPELEEPVVISQQVAPAFKKWMNEA